MPTIAYSEVNPGQAPAGPAGRAALEALARPVEAAVAGYNAVRGYELDDTRHGLVMLLADIIGWARLSGADPSRLYQEASELERETRML